MDAIWQRFIILDSLWGLKARDVDAVIQLGHLRPGAGTLESDINQM